MGVKLPVPPRQLRREILANIYRISCDMSFTIKLGKMLKLDFLTLRVSLTEIEKARLALGGMRVNIFTCFRLNSSIYWRSLLQPPLTIAVRYHYPLIAVKRPFLPHKTVRDSLLMPLCTLRKQRKTAVRCCFTYCINHSPSNHLTYCL